MHVRPRFAFRVAGDPWRDNLVNPVEGVIGENGVEAGEEVAELRLSARHRDVRS